MLAVREVNTDYNNKEYPGNLTPYVVITCIVSCMGGLVFGIDIGISGGVTLIDPLVKKFFPVVLRNDKNSTNEYCQYVSQTMTMFTLSLYLAALIGSLVASTVTRKFGLRKSMMFGGVFSCVGAIINVFANNIWMHIVGRMLLRFGIGFINQSVPLYLSEMAPYRFREALNMVFQLSVTIGILVANVLNCFASNNGGWGHRLRFGGVVVPALILVGSLLLPETSTSLIERGLRENGRDQLRRVRGVEDVDDEFNDLIAASEVLKLVEYPWINLLRRKYRPQFCMAVLIPIFKQLAGVNVTIFYATIFYNTIGFGSDPSLMSVVITFGFNVAGTFVSLYGVNKWGRPFLFLQGGVQMLIFQCISVVAIGAQFRGQEDLGLLPKWYVNVVVFVICIFISAISWSWGSLGWLEPSEIFPLEIRSAAQSLNMSVNMIFTFAVPEVFLKMLCHLKFRVFVFFPFSMLFITIFIFYFFVETKGIPREEMAMVLKSHWYWSRLFSHDDYPSISITMDVIGDVINWLWSTVFPNVLSKLL